MVLPHDSYGEQPELSGKATTLILAAASGAGTDEGWIRFERPQVAKGPFGTMMLPDLTANFSCTAGGEIVQDSETSHRASLEYREAAEQLVNANLAERVQSGEYRLTLLGYRRADAIMESDENADMDGGMGLDGGPLSVDDY